MPLFFLFFPLGLLPTLFFEGNKNRCTKNRSGKCTLKDFGLNPYADLAFGEDLFHVARGRFRA